MSSITRLKYAIELKYEIADNPADFIFNIHAAQNPWQKVVDEAVTSSQPVTSGVHVDPALGSRFMRMSAPPGHFSVRYEATVDIAHHFESPARIEETPVARLPSEVLAFIYPSRYCQSDRLRRYATREFGHLRPGYWRVQAIRDWVCARTAFVPGTTDSSTSAADTLLEQRGVCRDFAHLMIATGLVRIGTGRDAADVSFATLFGSVKSFAPAIAIEAVDDPARGFILPRHSAEAVSTHGARAMSR